MATMMVCLPFCLDELLIVSNDWLVTSITDVGEVLNETRFTIDSVLVVIRLDGYT